MIKIIFSLLFTIGIINVIFGQNYQTINSNKIAYFENSYKNIKCIRIDSVKNQPDSILFPFYEIKEIDYDCYSPYTASWIGKSITINKNGLNKYINYEGDTITIKTDAVLGEKWITFQILDSITIEAKVIKHDTLHFLGLNDSVKTINFQVFDKNMNQLDCSINNMTIQISKNFGFIQTLNFYLFPNYEMRNEQFEEYHLVGLSNPKVGIQNLTLFDVYNFQVGDELHILEEVYWIYSDGGYSKTDKIIYKYLERTDYLDSIVYRYTRKESVFENKLGKDYSSFYDDTLNLTIKSDSLFDKLPGEPIITAYNMFNVNMTNKSQISKTYPGEYNIYSFSDDSCWNTPIVDGCFPDYEYIKGLGGPYYACSGMFYVGYSQKNLVYYKKGSKTWGSPLKVTEFSDIDTLRNIIIFLEPTSDFVYITISSNNYSDLFFSMYDIKGNLLKHNKIDANNTRISIADLNFGIYIIKILDKNKILKTKKIIIK